MQKKNTKNKTLKIVSIVIAGVVLAGVISELTGLTHVVRKQKSNTPSMATPETVNYNPPTEEEKTQVEENKTDEDKIKDSQNQTNPTTVVDKNVVISSAEQQSTKDVVVQTQLYGIGWQTCTLTLTMGDKKVTKTAETLYQQSFSTCLGFSVPYSELGQAGTWQVDLSVSNSDGQPHSAASLSLKVGS